MKMSSIPKWAKVSAIPLVMALVAVPIITFAASNNEDGAKPVNMTSSEKKPESTKKEAQIAPVEPEPEVQQPVVETQPEPQQPVETVDSVLNNAGWNESDRKCVDMIRERAPRWFVDVETTKKFVDVTKQYIGTCVGVARPSTPGGLSRQFEVKTDRDMGITQ